MMMITVIRMATSTGLGIGKRKDSRETFTWMAVSMYGVSRLWDEASK